jgi:hypothetical protein
MALFGPTLPTLALQQVGSYQRYTGRGASAFGWQPVAQS